MEYSRFLWLRLLLRQCVDLAGEARLLTGCAVLVEDLVGSSLIDRLAGKTQAGLRFVDIARLDSLEDAAGSRADTGLLSSVLCMALSVGFHTQDRCFDVRQVFHPLAVSFPNYFITTDEKLQGLAGIFLEEKTIFQEIASPSATRVWLRPRVRVPSRRGARLFASWVAMRSVFPAPFRALKKERSSS